MGKLNLSRGLAQSGGWMGWADRLGKLRDIMLIGSGVIYVAGYLSRAVHAWLYNLGALPGAQFEYFVAGFVLLLPLGSLLLVVWLIWVGFKTLAAWSAQEPSRQNAIAILFAICIVGPLLLFILPIRLVGERNEIGLAVFIVTFVLGLVYSAAGGKLPDSVRSVPDAPLSRSKEKAQATEQEPLWLRVLLDTIEWIGKLFAYLAALMFALLIVMIIASMPVAGALMLPYVPQELGGTKPKCATFDLAVDKVSPPIYEALADRSNQATGKVMKSIPLQVFSSGEPWLVKIPKQKDRFTTYRLTKESVHAIVWCEWPKEQTEGPKQPAKAP